MGSDCFSSLYDLCILLTFTSVLVFYVVISCQVWFVLNLIIYNLYDTDKPNEIRQFVNCPRFSVNLFEPSN